MQLNKIHADVTAVGVQASTQFTAVMSGKLFRMFSDSMYENKIGSIVRELSCNALDSHTMARNPSEPFYIHMPDVFEPWFSVRDNGIGMTHDDVVNIYTTYGESTKDAGNECIGAFGVGGKSPFAYTDAFNVTIRFDGMKRIYSMFIGSDDLPVCSLMDESETDERNGMEVQMAVKPNDIYKFRNEVATQLRFFKVKPIIENDSTFKWAEHGTPIIETPHFALYPGDGDDYIIQGQVGYPLDYDQVMEGLDEDNKKFFKSISAGRAVHLYFDIGKIEVTTSREGIQYREFTLKNINDRLTEARAAVNDFIVNQVNAYTTDWDKAAFVNSDDFVSTVVHSTGFDLPSAKRVAGHYGAHQYVFDIEKLLNVDKIISSTDAAGVVTTKTIREPDFYTMTYTTMGGNYRGSRVNGIQHDIVPTPSKKIVIRDTSVRPVVRINEFCKTNNLGSCLSIQPKIMKGFDAKAFAAKLTVALGGFTEIYLVSEMPEPVRQPGAARSSYARPTCYIKDAHSADLTSVYHWTRGFDKLDDMPDGGYYVITDRYNIVLDGTTISNVNRLLASGYLKDKEIIAIRASDLKRIEDDPEWIPLETVVAETVAEVVKNPGIRRLVNANSVYTAVNRVGNNYFWEFVKQYNGALGKSHPFVKAYRLQQLAIKMQKKYNKFAQFAGLIDTQADAGKIDTALHAFREAKGKYPLVSDIYGQWYGVKNMSHVIMYINMVDKLEATAQDATKPKLTLAA